MDEQGEVQQGGSGDVMPLERLKSVEERQAEVEKSIQNMQNEFLLMQTALMKVDAQREIVEETQKRHDEEIRELKVMASEMKEQGNRMSIQYNSIYTTLLQVLQQVQSDGTKERAATQKFWGDILKYVLGGTVLFIVAKLFVTP